VNNINQLDSELLQGYLDNLGKNTVQQMLSLYQQQSALYLEEIEQALTNQSHTLWQEKCHKMKGAAGSVGLVKVHAKLVVIEECDKAWTEKRLYLEQLIQLNNNALVAFSTWLDK